MHIRSNSGVVHVRGMITGPAPTFGANQLRRKVLPARDVLHLFGQHARAREVTSAVTLGAATVLEPLVRAWGPLWGQGQ